MLTDAAAKIGVIAITDNEILIERSGERLPLTELETVIATSRESMIVTNGFDHLFTRLNNHFKEHEEWQYRAVIQEMEGDPRVSTVVSFFGFKRRNHKQRRRGRYFYPVSLDTFVRDLSQFPGRDALSQMLAFGISLRDFCIENGIRPRTTGAGIANQLLRHPLFYPEARRRVPHFINEIARPHLPGNFYSLTGAMPGETIEAATYIDQRAAHHYAARTTPLPCANSTYARGHSKTEAAWIFPTDSAYPEIRKHYGLLKVNVTVPVFGKGAYPFVQPTLKEPGTRTVYVWSNELAYAESWGVVVNYVVAAYSSPVRDTGLPQYAEWSERQAPWKKQMLLSAYGMLATRSRRTRFVHGKGNGEAVQIPIGPNLIDGSAGSVRTSHSGVSNVVQRGLIESYVRLLSLSLAYQIEELGGEVLSIYGDGVFMRATPGEQLPIAYTAPWREKGQIHNLTYDCATRLTSDEITRLPGTPRFREEYLAVPREV